MTGCPGSGPIQQGGIDLDLASLINQVATLGVGNGAACRSSRSEQREAKEGPDPYPEQSAPPRTQSRRLLPPEPGQPLLSGPGGRGDPGPSWTASAGTLAPRRQKVIAMTSETSKTSCRRSDNYHQAGEGTTLLSVPIRPDCLAESEAQNPLPMRPPPGRGRRPYQPALPPRRSVEPGSENLQRGNRGGRPPDHPARNALPGNADTRSPPEGGEAGGQDLLNYARERGLQAEMPDRNESRSFNSPWLLPDLASRAGGRKGSTLGLPSTQLEESIQA